jgi:hypothetical protein
LREPPRRRRTDDEPSAGLPLFPLVLVVILAGLLLGGALAHFFGGSATAPHPAQSALVQASPPETAPPIAVAATPTVQPTKLPASRPTPGRQLALPSARPSQTPSPSISPSATPSATAAPTATAAKRLAPKPSAHPAPSAHAAPSAHLAPSSHPPAVLAATAAPMLRPPAPSPSAAAVAASADDRAGTIVRSYLGALARGDRATASSYLANGSPNESFVNAGSEIESVHSASSSDGTYKVTADVKSNGVEYYGTFTLEPGPAGLQITEHYWIKPQ